MSGEQKTVDEVWEGLSQLDDKYFLEEYHPSYFKVKEGMEEDHNKLRDAMEFIEKQGEEIAALKAALSELIPIAERHVYMHGNDYSVVDRKAAIDRAKKLLQPAKDNQ